MKEGLATEKPGKGDCKMKRLKIGITGRKSNRLAREIAKKAISLLEGRGIGVEVDKSFLGSKNGSGNYKALKKFSCGIVLSFGGDGTLLETVRELKRKIPVLGINCGNRGALQAYGHTEIEVAIEAVLMGHLRVEERTRILAKVDGKAVGEALNEVLVVPAKSGRLLNYRLQVSHGKKGRATRAGRTKFQGNVSRHGKIADEWADGGMREEAGDGLIVATPTGSTAHALSAGGPIVKGNAAIFVVVSINPVDWKHRPLVINDHEKVVVSGFGKMKAEIVLDGQKWFSIRRKLELMKGKSALLAWRKV